MDDRGLLRKVLEYADLLARDPGRVPSADVAWKLRSIIGGPDAGVPDAPVVAFADVKIRRPPHAHT
jgi:hypothetical protein